MYHLKLSYHCGLGVRAVVFNVSNFWLGINLVTYDIVIVIVAAAALLLSKGPANLLKIFRNSNRETPEVV